MGSREASRGTLKTLLAEAEGGLCSLLGQTTLASTHSPLWIELLSTEAGTACIPRTQEKEGRQWGQGGDPWNTEDPATEAEAGFCALFQDRPPPGQHPLTSLDRHQH